MLFDIGIAGPIAGLRRCRAGALVIGLGMSHVARVPPDFVGLELGEPLLFQAVSWLLWGAIPEGYSLNLHPMALRRVVRPAGDRCSTCFPLGQLDGGHIAYAVFGRRSRYITLGTLAIGRSC